MHAEDYNLIAGHELRNVMRAVITDPRDVPRPSELKERIDEALPGVDQRIKDALLTKAGEAATQAIDPGARWDLRARMDLIVLDVLKKLDEADRFVPKGTMPGPGGAVPVDGVVDEPVDAAAAAAAILEGDDPTQKGARAIQEAGKQTELAANLARQMGGQA